MINDLLDMLEDIGISYARKGNDTAIIAGISNDYYIQYLPSFDHYVVEYRFGVVGEFPTLLDLEEWLLDEGF